MQRHNVRTTSCRNAQVAGQGRLPKRKRIRLSVSQWTSSYNFSLFRRCAQVPLLLRESICHQHSNAKHANDIGKTGPVMRLYADGRADDSGYKYPCILRLTSQHTLSCINVKEISSSETIERIIILLKVENILLATAAASSCDLKVSSSLIRVSRP